MQRDEFLPLRVIRQELAAGTEREGGGPRASQRRAVSVESGVAGARFTAQELVEQTGASPDLIHELREYRLLLPERMDGIETYDDSDRQIVQAATELARYGVSGRHLKVFRPSADREAGLLEQVLGARLMSSNRANRREAIE